MPKRTSFASCLLVASALSPLACSAAPGAPAADRAVVVEVRASSVRPALARAVASGDTGALVWTRDDEGRATTYRVDPSGDVVESLDGIHLAVGDAVLTWSPTTVAVPTHACAYTDEHGNTVAGPPAEPGTATRVALVRRADGRAQTIVDPPMADGDASYEHHAELAASVGPLLFVRESTYVYGCGAHGDTSVSAFVWEARRGERIDLASQIGEIAAVAEQARRALEREDGDGTDDVGADDPDADDELAMTEIVPSYGPRAKLRVGLRFTEWACYACTRGGWSSYTASTIIGAPRLPASLAPFAEPPASVRAFAAAHPQTTIGGYGRLPRGWAASERGHP